MTREIENNFGEFNCFLGSAGLELNVFVNKSLSSSQFEILIGVFSELKKYYIDTNIDKNIKFVGTDFPLKLQEKLNCSNIDEIIENLKLLMEQNDYNDIRIR